MVFSIYPPKSNFKILIIMIIFIALLDSLQKTQGVLATGVFTLLSVYYSLQSLIGSIFELLGNMLAVMVIVHVIGSRIRHDFVLFSLVCLLIPKKR